jgi:hypothetical protein
MVVEPLVKIRKNNELSFRDGSTLKLNDMWLRALSDKLKHEKKTPKEFLTEFGAVLQERWKTKTCTDKFGFVIKWGETDRADSFRTNFENLADLAERELYYYLRAWILGLLLSEHGGRGAIILTDDGLIEYPKEKERQ